MDIIISNASQQPIYEQIYLQIKAKMMEILELGKVCGLTCGQLAEMLMLLEEE